MKDIEQGLAILFKSASTITDELYLKELEKLKLRCHLLPSLSFVFQNEEKIRSCLGSSELYAGLIFTSPRSVEGLLAAFQGNETALNEVLLSWHHLHTFSIGETTNKLVECKLGLKSAGSECGNAEKLAVFIKEALTSAKKPFLCPCGNLSGDTLSKTLGVCGILTESVIVYKTVPHPGLTDAVLNVMQYGLPEYIVYFSPSSVEFTLQVFAGLNISVNDCKFVAIGSTTAAALESKHLPVHCVAHKPTPTALAQAIVGE